MNPRYAVALALLTLLGCTEHADVVAVALSASDASMPGTGGQIARGEHRAPPSPDKFDCQTEALATLRIPEEALLIAVSCEVSTQALQADEDERLAAISELLASTTPFDFNPLIPVASQCQERGLWWVQGDTVILCEQLCEQLRDWLNGTLQRACPR